jgi:signal peptidase I
MPTDDQGNTSIELACGLAEEVVRTFGEVRLRTSGTSMVPSILPGDLVSIHWASLQDISTGEIVVFSQNGRLVVHRVVDRKVAAIADSPEEWRLITRGDRLRHDDPPISSLELLGRVVSIERDHRKVDLSAIESNHLIVRLLQSSDRVTYLYLRLAVCWRTLFLRRAKCPV